MSGAARGGFLAVIALFLSHAASGVDYPRIQSLTPGDPVFRQYADDVAFARKALASGGKTEPPLGFYSYRVGEGDDLFALAARCAVPYDAIASLNRLSSPAEVLPGRLLALPTLPGLYLSDEASNTLETLLLSSFDPDEPAILSFRFYEPETGRPRTVHCIPEGTFEGTVRAWFLIPRFRFPLPGGTVSSSFGMRKNPVTGNLVFHKGVDLAAPRNTPVMACADGTVTAAGTDPIYGNYVILRHEGGRESLYGHLQSVKIELRDTVKSGTILGTVGSTGQSTGPHLHFEIHENGVPKDPQGFIKGNSPR